MGFLIPGSQVRVLPGAPAIACLLSVGRQSEMFRRVGFQALDRSTTGLSNPWTATRPEAARVFPLPGLSSEWGFQPSPSAGLATRRVIVPIRRYQDCCGGQALAWADAAATHALLSYLATTRHVRRIGVQFHSKPWNIPP